MSNPNEARQIAAVTNAAANGNADAVEANRCMKKNAPEQPIILGRYHAKVVREILDGRYVNETYKQDPGCDHAIMKVLRILLRGRLKNHYDLHTTMHPTLLVGCAAYELAKYEGNSNVSFHFYGRDPRDPGRIVRDIARGVMKDLRSRKAKPNIEAIKLLENDGHAGLLHRVRTGMTTIQDDEVLKSTLGTTWRKQVRIVGMQNFLDFYARINSEAKETPEIKNRPGWNIPKHMQRRYHVSRDIPDTKVDTLFFHDSAYNLDEKRWYEWFERTGAQEAWVTGAFPENLIFGGADFPQVEDVYYGYNESIEHWQQDDTCERTVVSHMLLGSGEPGYSHRKDTWSLLMRKQVLHSDKHDFRLFSEHREHFGIMRLFRIHRVPLTHGFNAVRQWKLASRYRYIYLLDPTSIYDMTRMRYTGDGKPRYFTIFRSEYESITSYLASLAIEHILPQNAAGYIRSRRSGILLAQESLPAWMMSPELEPKVIMICCVIGILRHVQAGEFIKEISKGVSKGPFAAVKRAVANSFYDLVDFLCGSDLRKKLVRDAQSQYMQVETVYAKTGLVQDDVSITFSSPDSYIQGGDTGVPFNKMVTPRVAQDALMRQIAGQIEHKHVFDFFAGEGGDAMTFMANGAYVSTAEKDDVRRKKCDALTQVDALEDWKDLWLAAEEDPAIWEQKVAYFDPPFGFYGEDGYEQEFAKWKGPMIWKVPADYSPDLLKLDLHKRTMSRLALESDKCEFAFILFGFESFNETVQIPKIVPEGYLPPPCWICEALKGKLGQQIMVCSGHPEKSVDMSLSSENIKQSKARLTEDKRKITEEGIGGTDDYAQFIQCIIDFLDQIQPFEKSVNIEYIRGGPGCGKSYIIQQLLNSGDGVVLPFRALKGEYTKFASDNKLDITVRTFHAMILDNKVSIRSGTMYVDEFTSLPYEWLAIAAQKLALKRIVLVGDLSQCNTIEGVEGMANINHIDGLAEGKIRTHLLKRNFRNPSGIVGLLNEHENYEMEAMRPDFPIVKMDLDTYHAKYASREDIPPDERFFDICFSRKSQDELAKIAEIKAETVRSCQGLTKVNVALHVRKHDRLLTRVSPLRIVGLSRHKEKLFIVTDGTREAESFAEFVTTLGANVAQKAVEDIGGAVAHVEAVAQVPYGEAKKPKAALLPVPATAPIEDVMRMNGTDRAHVPENIVGSVIAVTAVRSGVMVVPDPQSLISSKGAPIETKEYEVFAHGNQNNFSPDITWQTLNSFFGRYMSQSGKPRFDQSKLELAHKIANKFFDDNIDEIRPISEVERGHIQATYMKQLGRQKLIKRLQRDQEGAINSVSFFLKVQAKVYAHAIKAEKYGQGVASLNTNAATLYRGFFRMFSECFALSLKSHVLLEHGKTSEQVIEQAVGMLKQHPEHGVSMDHMPQAYVDFTEFDKAQCEFSMAIEAQILLRFGVPEYLIKVYFDIRRGCPMTARVQGAKVAKGRSTSEKMSGEPGTLIMNTIVSACLSHYVLEAKGPYIMFCKGDDVVKKGAGMQVDFDREQEIFRASNMALKITMGDKLDWCGYTIMDGLFIPSLLKLAYKVVGHRIRDEEHFNAVIESVKDRLRAVHSTGAQWDPYAPDSWRNLQVAALFTEVDKNVADEYYDNCGVNAIHSLVDILHGFTTQVSRMNYKQAKKFLNKVKMPQVVPYIDRFGNRRVDLHGLFNVETINRMHGVVHGSKTSIISHIKQIFKRK
jgi:hypothetical protein